MDSKEFYNTTQFIILTGDSAGHHDFSNSLSVVKKLQKILIIYFQTISIKPYLIIWKS